MLVVIALGFGADALRTLRQGGVDDGGTRGNLLNTEAINQPLEGVERAEIDIETGISAITVRASETTQLVEGSVSPNRNEEIRTSFSKDGDTGYFSLNSKSSGPLGFFSLVGNDSQWDLELNRSVSIELAIDTGAGNADLNLQRLNLTDLRVNTGVGNTTVMLPSRGEYDVDIDAGIGNLSILIPETIAAHIDVDTGIGAVDVDDAFRRNDDKYISPGFSDAKHQVTLDVNGGIGSIEIRQLEEQ